jgi:CDGSH-type Zn-finger protein
MGPPVVQASGLQKRPVAQASNLHRPDHQSPPPEPEHTRARLVRHDRAGPIKIEPQDKPVFICGCGLTKNFPFCDGSHKTCTSEEEGVLYVYDKDRNQIVEQRPDE